MPAQTFPAIAASSAIQLNASITSDTVVGPTAASVIVAAPGAGRRIVVSAVFAFIQNNSGAPVGRTARLQEGATTVFSLALATIATINDINSFAAYSLELAIAENTACTFAFGAGDAGANQSVTMIYRIIEA